MTNERFELVSFMMEGSIPISPREGLSFRYHFKALENGYLVTRFCQRCDKYTFPPSDRCQYCSNKGTVWKDLSRYGHLYSKTSMSFTPEVFHPYSPVSVGIIDLEDEVRLLAWLIDHGLSLDSEVELVCLRFDDGVLLGARARHGN